MDTETPALVNRNWRPWGKKKPHKKPKKISPVSAPIASEQDSSKKSESTKILESWNEHAQAFELQKSKIHYTEGLQFSYDHNDEAVEEAFEINDVDSERRIKSLCGVIISKIAEDHTGYPTDGEDEWDMERLMYRRISKIPLASCRQTRERERIIFIADTSPSCDEEAEFYSSLLSSLADRGDVDLIRAPNARPCSYYNRKTKKWDSMFKDYDNKYYWDWNVESWHHFWQNRTIIFFGDLDGQEFIVQGSLHNVVYAFLHEYTFRNWVSTWEEGCKKLRDSGFKGKTFRCSNVRDFIMATKGVK
jgi:hypothetical protein